MKKVWGGFAAWVVAVCATLFQPVMAFAQEYDLRGPKIRPYNGAFQYILFGVVICFLGFLGYRYWKDSQPDH